MRRLLATCMAVLALASTAFAPAVPAPPQPATALRQAPTDEAPADEAPADEAPADEAPTDEAPTGEAPTEDALSAHEAPSSGRTMVVFTDQVDDVAATAQRLLAPLGLRAVHLYQHALRGVAVEASPSRLQLLAADPAVAYLEEDRAVRPAGQTVPRGVRRIDAVQAAGIGSGRSVPVDIAILDTGIASHSDLRVVQRLDCTDSTIEPSIEYVNHALFGNCKQGGSDADGHGTHVAGIAAARDNGSGVVGVAPGARLWAIKVIQSTSSGALSDVVAGVDELVRRAPTIEVANISLVANGSSEVMDEAIGAATDAGVVVVVAAGNDSADARRTTPANSPDAITVSAVTDLDGRAGGRLGGTCHGRDDRFATYSNFGSVVDIAAPGSCIVSTARGGGTTTKSGTSMATPHVAGAAALRIHQRGLAASASRSSRVLDDLLSTSARENTTCGYRGSPSNERLLDLRRGC